MDSVEQDGEDVRKQMLADFIVVDTVRRLILLMKSEWLAISSKLHNLQYLG